MNEQTVQVQKRALEMRKVGATVAQSLKYDRRTDPMIAEEVLHCLTGYVLAEKISSGVETATTTHEWPATTWQMFKHSHRNARWLAWLVRRHPVRFVTTRKSVQVDVARWLQYPQAQIAMVDDRLGRPLIVDEVRFNPFR